MILDRERFLFLTAVLAGCHQPSSSVRGVTLSRVATDATVTPAADFCQAVAAENDALLAKPSGSCEEYASQQPAVLAKIKDEAKFLHTCHVGKGTWAVRVQSVAFGAPSGEAGGCGWSAHYEWVFQRNAIEAGADSRIAVARSRSRQWLHFPDSDSESVSSSFYDYDGDGNDEAIVAVSSWENGGGRDQSWEVLRGTELAVASYALGFTPDGVADVDGDGRPDLLEGGYFHVTCPGAFVEQRVHGVALLHHSLAGGTFSTTDEVARRWAVTNCPRPLPTHTGDGECALHASCQRLWNRSPSDIHKWALTEPACNDTCMSADAVRELVTQAIPFKALDLDTPAPFVKKPSGS